MGVPVVALTFGSKSGLDETHALVSGALGVVFERRYSDYFGGFYYVGKYDAGDVRVHLNEDGDAPAEPEWPGPVIVRVSAAVDAAGVRTALAALSLLGQQDWTRE